MAESSGSSSRAYSALMSTGTASTPISLSIWRMRMDLSLQSPKRRSKIVAAEKGS